MIDSEGFRLNVGIIVCNNSNQLLLCRRLGKPEAWQFPQGGIRQNESPRQAMFRELVEELGLSSKDVDCLAESENWFSYTLPKEYRRYYSKPLCIGQKQKWFLLRLTSSDEAIVLDADDHVQEFDQWCWVDYWQPIKKVIAFKQDVYRDVLTEFAPLLGVDERN